jgi:hypothetical protein
MVQYFIGDNTKSGINIKSDERFVKNWREVMRNPLYDGLSEKDMEELIKKDPSKDEIFDLIFNSNTFDGPRILPGYDTINMLELEKELYESFNKVGSLSEGRELTELMKFGNDVYAKKYKNDESSLFKVEKLQYVGRGFVVVPVQGYHMIARYTPKDIGKFAPPEANSYLVGNILLVELENGYFYSPIIAGHLIGPIPLENGDYHILPVKFFNATDINWNKEYKIDKEEIDKGNYIIVRQVVKDLDGNIVSRSDKGYIFPHP